MHFPSVPTDGCMSASRGLPAQVASLQAICMTEAHVERIDLDGLLFYVWRCLLVGSESMVPSRAQSKSTPACVKSMCECTTLRVLRGLLRSIKCSKLHANNVRGKETQVLLSYLLFDASFQDTESRELLSTPLARLASSTVPLFLCVYPFAVHIDGCTQGVYGADERGTADGTFELSHALFEADFARDALGVVAERTVEGRVQLRLRFLRRWRRRRLPFSLRVVPCASSADVRCSFPSLCARKRTHHRVCRADVFSPKLTDRVGFVHVDGSQTDPRYNSYLAGESKAICSWKEEHQTWMVCLRM